MQLAQHDLALAQSQRVGGQRVDADGSEQQRDHADGGHQLALPAVVLILPAQLVAHAEHLWRIVRKLRRQQFVEALARQLRVAAVQRGRAAPALLEGHHQYGHMARARALQVHVLGDGDHAHRLAIVEDRRHLQGLADGGLRACKAEQARRRAIDHRAVGGHLGFMGGREPARDQAYAVDVEQAGREIHAGAQARTLAMRADEVRIPVGEVAAGNVVAGRSAGHFGPAPHARQQRVGFGRRRAVGDVEGQAVLDQQAPIQAARVMVLPDQHDRQRREQRGSGELQHGKPAAQPAPGTALAVAAPGQGLGRAHAQRNRGQRQRAHRSHKHAGERCADHHLRRQHRMVGAVEQQRAQGWRGPPGEQQAQGARQQAHQQRLDKELQG